MKSTTESNLTFSLKAERDRLDILYADIYGPSLTTFVRPDERTENSKTDGLFLLEKNGLKLMSFKYIN